VVEIVDPLQHPEWDAWVGRFGGAQFFHGRNWARVLCETYGHRPIYPCRRAEVGISGALAVMEVRSALTGRRGVALPFTDFCYTLGADQEDGKPFFEAAIAEGKRRGWRYFECRNGDDGGPAATPSLSFWGHEIDLTVGSRKLFEGMSSGSRRAVRKAEKAGLKIEFGTDAASMEAYFELHCQTRKRHGLPPQPISFFKSIQARLLSAKQGEVGLVFMGGRPIAGAVYLWFGRRAMYKFGASDSESRAERPNNLLMWLAMERLAGQGFEALHLGRTSLMHEGLRHFKIGFGAREGKIDFCKFDFRKQQFVREQDRVEGWFNRIFGKMPEPALRLAGKMLYPHMS